MQKKHSGKMGAIALPVALIAAAVGVLLWMLTGAQGYRAADWTDTDGQRYYRNLVTHQAFAADVDWDGSDGAVIVIPDEVHGYKVTALGGYIGRGVPTAFALNAPEIWNTQVVFGDEKVAADAEKDYPNAKIVDCTVTLRLGRNVKALNEVSCFGWQGYDENGAETVWRLRWNVEFRNQNFIYALIYEATIYTTPNANPTACTRNATTHAMRHCTITVITAAFVPPISRFTVAIAATHGV